MSISTLLQLLDKILDAAKQEKKVNNAFILLPIVCICV